MGDDDSSQDCHDDAPSAPKEASDKTRVAPIFKANADKSGYPEVKTSDSADGQSATEKEILDRVKKGERWMIFLTAVVAFTTVFQTVQSCNNNASTTAQVDKIIKASERSAQAAENFSTTAGTIKDEIGSTESDFSTMAGNSADAIKATQGQMRLDQRAWLGACGTQLTDFEAGKTIRVILRFCNAGKTPALKVTEAINWMVSPFPRTGPTAEALAGLYFLPSDPVPPQGILLLSGGSGGGKIVVSDRQIREERILNSFFAQIQSGSQIVYWFGVVKYTDIFGKPHKTQFCTFLANPNTKEMNSCDTYNEMD